MSQPFINQWKDCPKEDIQKTTVDIHRKTLSKITKVHSKQGVLQTTIYILITKLANELERLGLNEYDPGAYEIGVANCTITLGLPGSTASVPPAGTISNGTPKAVGGDDGLRTPELARPLSGPATAPDSNGAPSSGGNKRPRRVKAKVGEKGSGPQASK